MEKFVLGTFLHRNIPVYAWRTWFSLASSMFGVSFLQTVAILSSKLNESPRPCRGIRKRWQYAAYSFFRVIK